MEVSLSEPTLEAARYESDSTYFTVHSSAFVLYCRTGFNYEFLVVTNCEFMARSQHLQCSE